MEQFIELLPMFIGAMLVIGGGTFSLVRWLFAQEEKRREKEQLVRDKVAAAKLEAEEKIWERCNATIDGLRLEVKSLRCDNKLLREEIAVLKEELHILSKLLEEQAI